MRDFLPFVVVGLASGSVYGLAGTGLVLTYKTSGIFNFAHGTVAALMAYLFYDLRERAGLPWPVAMAVCLLVIAPVIAFALERMARRLTDAPAAMKVVATVGLVVAIQQLAIIRYGASSIRSQPFLPTGTIRLGGVNVGVDQLVVMAIALVSTLALTRFFALTTLGRGMRAVVDNADLLALTGVSPTTVRRLAWYVGAAFAGLSGIVLAPTVGLDATVLTLLVVQAFGAAAIGRFTSIPLTYAGGLALGVVGALSTKYVATMPTLNGLPASLPFIVLFVVLVAAPRRWLTDFTVERRASVAETRHVPRGVLAAGGALLLLAVVRAPGLVGVRLGVYTSALAYAVVLLSLALLVRTSGQVSLAQLAFAAVGGAASARLGADAGLPWLLATTCGALVAVPVGALLAVPAIRRSGLYLALATFGFAVLLERMVFSTDLMFGGGASSLPAARPGFATGDEAYFYVVVAFLAASVALVTAVHRSRLGRLLRAMADSPTALATFGTNVTAVKVIVFCVAAFLAGLGGALMGPVTGTVSPVSFGAFSSLTLVVVLAIVPGGEVAASIGAAVALVVVPSYITSSTMNDYLPVVFGVSAVAAAMGSGDRGVPAWLTRAVGDRRRPGRSAAMSRLVPADAA